MHPYTCSILIPNIATHTLPALLKSTSHSDTASFNQPLANYHTHLSLVLPAYIEHIPETASHKLVAEMDLEVDIVWCVDNGVDELKAGQLEHRVVGLLEGREDRVKALDVTKLPVNCHCLQHTVVSVGGRDKVISGGVLSRALT